MENRVLTNIMYATVYVTDQDRALEFYTEKLGLERGVDYPGPDGTSSPWACPAARSRSSCGRTPRPPDNPGGAPWPLVLESDDLRKDFEVLRRRGVTFDEPEPQDYPFGVRIEAVDPDGNRISLLQPRPWNG